MKKMFLSIVAAVAAAQFASAQPMNDPAIPILSSSQQVSVSSHTGDGFTAQTITTTGSSYTIEISLDSSYNPMSGDLYSQGTIQGFLSGTVTISAPANTDTSGWYIGYSRAENRSVSVGGGKSYEDNVPGESAQASATGDLNDLYGKTYVSIDMTDGFEGSPLNASATAYDPAMLKDYETFSYNGDGTWSAAFTLPMTAVGVNLELTSNVTPCDHWGNGSASCSIGWAVYSHNGGGGAGGGS